MAPATMPEWARLIAQLGFPIVVASYMLFRMDGLVRALISKDAEHVTMLGELKEAIHSLTVAVDRQNGRR